MSRRGWRASVHVIGGCGSGKAVSPRTLEEVSPAAKTSKPVSGAAGAARRAKPSSWESGGAGASERACPGTFDRGRLVRDHCEQGVRYRIIADVNSQTTGHKQIGVSTTRIKAALKSGLSLEASVLSISLSFNVRHDGSSPKQSNRRGSGTGGNDFPQRHSPPGLSPHAKPFFFVQANLQDGDRRDEARSGTDYADARCPSEELDPAGTSNSMNVRLTEAEIHAVSTACRTAVNSHR
jgi:hypothetical protein